MAVTDETGRFADTDDVVEAPLWVCRHCGCVRAGEERPTECLHCRRGEALTTGPKLFRPLSVRPH